jgi:hypothetical protein
MGSQFSGTMVMNLKNRPDNHGSLDVCSLYEKICALKSDQFSCGITNYNLSAYSESLMIFIEMKITIGELISYN